MTAFGQGSFFVQKFNTTETFITEISKLFAVTKINNYYEL